MVRKARHSRSLAGGLTVQQFVFELSPDMIAERPPVWIVVLNAADQPNRQVLVHVFLVQAGRYHQPPVAADHLVNRGKVFFHSAVALRNRIIIFHDAFLSSLGFQKRQ